MAKSPEYHGPPLQVLPRIERVELENTKWYDQTAVSLLIALGLQDPEHPGRFTMSAADKRMYLDITFKKVVVLLDGPIQYDETGFKVVTDLDVLGDIHMRRSQV